MVSDFVSEFNLHLFSVVSQLHAVMTLKEKMQHF